MVKDVVDPVADRRLAGFVVNSHMRAHPNYLEGGPVNAGSAVEAGKASCSRATWLLLMHFENVPGAERPADSLLVRKFSMQQHLDMHVCLHVGLLAPSQSKLPMQNAQGCHAGAPVLGRLHQN